MALGNTRHAEFARSEPKPVDTNMDLLNPFLL